MKRPLLAILLPLLLLVPAAGTALAQGAPTEGDALRQAIDQARADLDSERKRIADALAAENARAEAAKKDLAAAAAASTAAQESLRKLQADIETTRTRVERMEDESSTQDAVSSDLRSLAREAADRARARAASLPPVAHFTTRQAEAAALLDAAGKSTLEQAPGVVEKVLALDKALRDEVSHIQSDREPVRCSDGAERPAQVAHAGGLAALFETEDGRRGVLLRGPDGQGYTWNDPLTGSIDQDVHTAISRIAAGDRIVPWPADPTAELRADRMHGDEGVVAYIRKGALALAPIVLLGLWSLLVGLGKSLSLRTERRRTDALLGTLVEAERKGDIAAAQKAIPERGVLATIARAGFERMGLGVDAAEEAMHEEAAARTPAVARGISTLAVFGSLAPMLGLLGTVVGLITTFHAISGRGDAHALAAGIAEALIATAGGLCVAIPTVLAHHLLAGKADAILEDVERGADAVAGLIAAKEGTAARDSSPAKEAART